MSSLCQFAAARFVGQNRGNVFLFAFSTKFAAELRNQTSFSAAEVRLPRSGRPLGDNEPKVTTTGWCRRYCCRWLPAELDGTWPRFPWFVEVPNPGSACLWRRLARSDYIMSLSTYMAPTYLHEFQHFVAPATFVCHCAPSWFDKFVSKWRRPLPTLRPR